IMDVRSWRLCPIHQAGNGTACSGGGCRKWLLIAKSLSPKWAVPKTASGNGYRIPQREGDSKILEGFRTLAGGKITRGKEPLIECSSTYVTVSPKHIGDSCARSGDGPKRG